MEYSDFANSIINTISTMTAGRIVFLIFLVLFVAAIITVFSIYTYRQYKKDENNIDTFLQEPKDRADIFIPGVSDVPKKKKETFVDKLKNKIAKKQGEE